MRLALTVLTFSWVVGMNLLARGEEQSSQYPLLTVFVAERAGASDEVVSEAERSATRVFRRAGVELDWVNCGEQIALSGSRCHQTIKEKDLVVRIVPRARTLSQEAFGVSFLTDGGGAYADVFFEPIRNLRNGIKEASLGIVLGNVIAHELGHLLLGSNAHSRDGIMQPHWQSEQLHRVAMGWMLFTPDQASKMRNRIAAFPRNGRDQPVMLAATRQGQD